MKPIARKTVTKLRNFSDEKSLTKQKLCQNPEGRKKVNRQLIEFELPISNI